MDTKQEFFNCINDYYVNVSNGKVPLELVNELSELVTNYYYEEYSRFGKQYPKSAKRYSTFQLKDLGHPTTQEMVIKYFKTNSSEHYRDFSQQLLNMSEEELNKFEKNREDFYKMW